MQKALGLSAYARRAFSSLSLRKRFAGLRSEVGTGSKPITHPMMNEAHFSNFLSKNEPLLVLKPLKILAFLDETVFC